MFISKKHLSPTQGAQGRRRQYCLTFYGCNDSRRYLLSQRPSCVWVLFIFLMVRYTRTGHLRRPGPAFEMSPILASLADYKSHMTVISDLRNKTGREP